MDFRLDRTDARGLVRLAFVVLACVVAVWAGVVVTDNPFILFAGLIAAGFVLTLGVNYRALAWLVIALQPAALIVPFLRGRPFFWELCALLAWPGLMAYFAMNRRRFEALALDREERWAMFGLLGYVFVLGVLMGVRGVGFRAFGGEQMGGRFYVQQIVLTIVPLLMITAGLSRRALFAAVITGWVMSLTFLVSDFALSYGNRAIQFLLFFFEVPNDAFNFEAGYEVTGVRRYQSLAACGPAILAATLTFLPLRKLLGVGGFVGLPLILLGLGLGLGSGYRTVLVLWIGIFFLLSIFQRLWNPARGAVAVLAISGFLGVLYAFAGALPLAVQRAVSFLPGINVSTLARDDAWDTLRDRLDVLALAWNDASSYWFVGRGFGMERLDLIPPDAAHAGVWLQYANGLFYNGTLGLFLKTGLPGLLCTWVFIWFVSRITVKLVRTVRAKPPEEQRPFELLCLLIAAQWFSTVAFFYLTHGDAGNWMQTFGLQAALIMACRRALHDEEETEPAA